MAANFVEDIAIVTGVGAATAVVARRLGQPTVVGYLLAGLIVGPYIPIPVFADADRVHALAEFGVVLVMFVVGLELRIAKLLRVLPRAGLTGLVQVGVLTLAGFGLGRALGWDPVASLFLGTCGCISSTMVVSKVFDQRPVAKDVRELVFGILVVQDVLAIVLIAAMTGVAVGGGLAAGDLALTLAKLVGVLLGMLAGGMLVVPRAIKWVARLGSVELDAVVALGLCFVLATAAHHLGYSVALGAFIGGILVAESGLGERMEHLIQPVRDFFAVIFFVSIGMTVDPREAWAHLPIALLMFLVVVVAQFVTVTASGLLVGNGLRRSVVAGLALGQIGEFAFILAAIGIGADIVPASLQPVLVTVAVLTAFTTPIALRFSDRAVRAVDRALPKRLAHLVALHEEWLERLRGGGPTPLARRAQRLIVIDALVLLGLIGLAALLAGDAPGWLVSQLGLSQPAARAILTVAAMLVATPFLVQLGRNALAYARHRADELAEGGGRKVGRRALRAITLSLVGVAVGVPMMLALGVLVGVPFAAAGLALGAVAVGAQLWTTAGRVDDQLRAAVVEIGSALATRPDAPRLTNPGLLPGLDDVVTVTVGANDPAAGRTLAELNLRARTGATVLAVRTGDDSEALPSGQRWVEAGDVLVLTGTEEAIASARDVLTRADS